MAYNYQPSDGYFDMNVERQVGIIRKNAREYEEHLKSQRQLEIAQQLSELAEKEYGEEILNNLEDQELRNLPDVTSIDIQTEIQWFMRPYLLDFLIEAHAAFGLLPETLFRTINLLDRYCSKRVVYRRHYQLVGCTALLIASKYGECSKKVPHIKELANMCCSLYDEDMFTQMERHVMMTLDWTVGSPTVDNFFDIALNGRMYDPEVAHMAQYIAEIGMFHKDFVSTKPSDMAKASLWLSRYVLGREQDHPASWVANYDLPTVISLSQHLHHPTQIVSLKYKSAHKSRASLVLDDFLTRVAAISRSQMVPLTPPADLSSPTADKNERSFYTPQKYAYPANMPHGCLTPPITPDLECPTGFKPGFPGRHMPATPTPSSTVRMTQQHHPLGAMM